MSANHFSIHTTTVCQPNLGLTAIGQLSQRVDGQISAPIQQLNQAIETKYPIQNALSLEQPKSGRCRLRPTLT